MDDVVSFPFFTTAFSQSDGQEGEEALLMIGSRDTHHPDQVTGGVSASSWSLHHQDSVSESLVRALLAAQQASKGASDAAVDAWIGSWQPDQ